MGDTEAKVSRILRLARYILAGIVLLFTVIAGIQVMVFPMLTIKFETGYGAQQLAAIKVKKGSKVDLPTPLKPGSYFVGWSLNKDSETVINGLDNINDGTTLYAVWDGVEKYSVLMVNGVEYDHINIFDTKDTGLTPDQLNERWRVPDDYDPNNDQLTNISNKPCATTNNFHRFAGWRYRNADNTDNELLYDNGTWTWVQRNAEGVATSSVITDENKFYTPNYRTTFNAILAYRLIRVAYYLPGDTDVAIHSDYYQVGDTITLPNPQDLPNKNYINTDRVAYWQIDAGKYYTQATTSELRTLLDRLPTVFAPGETVKIDPLWYYFGNSLKPNPAGEFVMDIQIRAVDCDPDGARYTMQLNTGLATSNDRVAIASVADQDSLSLTNPIVYDDRNFAFWLYKSPDILSYSFYDSRGEYHEIATTHAAFTSNLKLLVGIETNVAGQKIFLKESRGLNFKVNYRKANRDIKLEFAYGSGLAVLPNYNLQTGDITVPYTGRIGNQFTLVNAERYLKNDWLFYGWRLQGDPDPDRIYAAGESFTIPYLDTDVNTTLHFEAVWRLSRLLYDFDFNGGHWAVEPDFSAMKGAYGNTVQIVPDVPVRFGYTFVGWQLNAETTLREPGSPLTVGTEIQTLHAQWEKKKMNITFYSRIDAQGQMYPKRLSDGIEHKVGDTIRLDYMRDNAYWAFLGWEVGDSVVPANTNLCFDTDVLIELNCVDKGDTIEVAVYAAQEKITLGVSYFVRYQNSNNQVVNDPLTPRTDWVTELVPGNDNYFYQYAPFNKNNTREMQMRGSEFLGWDYELINNGAVVRRGEITELTTVPAGYQQVRVYTRLQPKDYVVEYYSFDQKLLLTDTNNNSTYHYENAFDLPKADEVGIPSLNADWGTFIGWSYEPDYLSGNPEIVYKVLDNNRPRLQLLASDQPYLTAGALYYSINCDQHDQKVGTTGKRYRLCLYAVYAQDFVTMAYAGLTMNGNMICPVFSDGDYTQTVLGGTTVAPNSPDFAEYGLTVRDDQYLAAISDRNFIGWRISVDDGVKPSMKEYLENKLWFPGEALPAVDFGLTFKAEYINYGTEKIMVGKTVYRVRSLSPTALKTPQVINDVDIVAFPDGNYVVPSGTITINSNQTVHLVVPAKGNIVLEPMAIKCDQVLEFYVGDNLTITGSPVYGANFQRYLVKKGYRLLTTNTQTGKQEITAELLNHTAKYNYLATNQGLLIDNDGTLLGVPSHTALTTAELRATLTDETYGITRVANYALTEINSLTTIDLAKNDLRIDDNALFSTYAQTIILPKKSADVASKCIAGWQYRLARVRFGDADTTAGSYAFVDNGILYYGTTKTHVMYVLPEASTSNLQYSARDLRFADTVTIINPYALAARFLENTTWGRINSITAENINVDLTHLIGLPANLPRFVHRDNPYRGPMIQPYLKDLQFTCDGYNPVTLSLAYGELFTIFNPKRNNPYNFIFDRPWHNFVAWINENNTYNVGEVYRVGVDAKMAGDGYTIILDASRDASWQSYPVRFHYFDGVNDLEYNPGSLLDTRGVVHNMEEIYSDPDFDLSSLYLPGVDDSFTRDGITYQFIGWGIKAAGSELSTRLWSNVAPEARLLPDKTRASNVTQGIKVAGAYSYYALYDKVSSNLAYNWENGSYTVKQGTNAKANKIYIPYAKYHDGYMVPITKVEKFNSLSTEIDEIIIGGAISQIADSAFEGLNATVTFQHQGQYIQYNNSSSLQQLTIGKRAFYGNNKMTIVYLPNATVSIEDSAFEQCSALTTVLFADEPGVTPSLNRLGNAVFRDDGALWNLELVNLIMNDRAEEQRFYAVGDGIFTNTAVRPVVTDESKRGKIVWLDTLLHVYQGTGSATLTVTESKIAGYAFANLNGVGTITPIERIEVSNPQVIIASNAFANLPTDVTEINLTKVNPNRVFDDAFAHLTHPNLTVRVGNLAAWAKIITITYAQNKNIKFV